MSKKIRIIARLEVKGLNVVKGIQMEGLRVVGQPETLSDKYFNQGIDEIIYSDIVASLYDRNHLSDLVTKVSNKIFIPLCVGGGVRSIENYRELLRAGADKISINSEATRNPSLIEKAANIFGSQCIVASIHAKKISENKWEPYIENGREKTCMDVIDWAKKLEDLGAGEILLISVDKDGTCSGFDIDLINNVTKSVNIPVIVSGGAGSIDDIINVCSNANPSAVAISHLLHFNKLDITFIKDQLSKNNINTRKHYLG